MEKLIIIFLVIYIFQLIILINQCFVGFSSRPMFYFGFVPVIWLLWYGYIFFTALFFAVWGSTFDYKNQKKKLDESKVPVDLEAQDRPSKRRYRKVYGANEREEK